MDILFKVDVDLLLRAWCAGNKGQGIFFHHPISLESEKARLQIKIEMRKSEIGMKISFRPVSDFLHHAHGVNPHEDGFQNPESCIGFIKLPVGIADLLPLLQNVHPGLSIHLCLSLKVLVFSEVSLLFLKNAKAECQKKGKDQCKGGSNDPV